MGKEINPEFSEWKDFIYHDFREKIGKIKNLVSKEFIDTAEGYLVENEKLLEISTKPCLLHKDFHFNHIFVDNNKISGVTSDLTN